MNSQSTHVEPFPPDYSYSKDNLWLKYLVDRVLAFGLLVVLSPVLGVIGLAITIQSALSPIARRPVFVSEERIFQGLPFRMFKFCTYFVGEDQMHVHKRGTTDFVNDRNVTPVGYVMRKFYLDELPQLWNILAGHMSFVGPRPVPDPMYEDVLGQGFQSKRVLRAGLCGPVQALKGQWREYGRYLDADEALIHEYSRRPPVGVLVCDLLIMWQTFRKVLDGDGLDNPAR